MGEWREVPDTELPVVWWQCLAEFYCPCGAELVVDDECPTLCSCGRQYQMDGRLRVKEPARRGSSSLGASEGVPV